MAVPEKENAETSVNRRGNSGDLVVPWRAVAFASILIAIGAFGTLTVVTTVGNVDVLSTIALALAIVASRVRSRALAAGARSLP